MRVLIVAPAVDVASTISFKAGREFAQYALSKGHEVMFLTTLDSSKPIFSHTIRKFKPHFVAYYGHGTPDMWAGNLVLPTLDESNAHVLGKVPATAIACYTARKLGRLIVQRGFAKTYIGSVNPLYVALPEEEHDYQRDFIDSFNVIPKALLDGKTAYEAYRKYKYFTREKYELYRSHIGTWPHADFYYEAMKHNHDSIVLLGDYHIRLGEVEYHAPEELEVPIWFHVLTLVPAAVVVPLAVSVAKEMAKKKEVREAAKTIAKAAVKAAVKAI